MSADQLEVAFERKDVRASVAYIFMGFITAMILGGAVTAWITFAYLTHFEQETKVLTDEVLRSKREAYRDQVREDLEKKYAKAIPNDPEEAKNQARIAFERIRVNNYVRPPMSDIAPLEGADILVPLHSGGQPNQFTIGQENIQTGNAKLAAAGIDEVLKKLAQPGALKSRPNPEAHPVKPVETNGGR